MKSGASPALNLATVTSHQSRESQNSRHDGSLRVTSNFHAFPLPWLAGMLNLERRQMVTYCLHGSEPMRCSNISKLGVHSTCWQHLEHFEDARSDGAARPMYTVPRSTVPAAQPQRQHTIIITTPPRRSAAGSHRLALVSLLQNYPAAPRRGARSTTMQVQWQARTDALSSS